MPLLDELRAAWPPDGGPADGGYVRRVARGSDARRRDRAAGAGARGLGVVVARDGPAAA